MANSFPQFIHSNKFALVHFWAAWNSEDIQMRAMIESQIPDDIAALIAFAKFEIDPVENHAICVQHKVLNVPFLALYRDGKLICGITGAISAEALVSHLKKLIE